MFTVLCRHAHSDWQSTEAFLYISTSLILGKHGHMDIEKHNLKRFTIHPLYKYLPTRELTVTNLKNLK